jgi:hypothetical protein
MAPRMRTAGFAVVSMRCSPTELRGLTTDSKNGRVFDGGMPLLSMCMSTTLAWFNWGDLETSVLVGRPIRTMGRKQTPKLWHDEIG